MSKGMLVDLSKCVGCFSCVEACRDENNLPYNDGKKLDAFSYTAIEEHDGIYVRKLCMHCESPSCASACPVSALYKTKLGPVVYDASKCLGCRYCMVACPFDIPKYEWQERFPRVRKCIMCIQRLEKGMPTACSEACPTGATTFGERDELIKEAKARIKDNPDLYIDHIYGEEEAGGTSILFLSPKSFDLLGFKQFILEKPYPELTWAVMSKIPPFVFVWGSFLAGLWWLTERKKKVAEAEKNAKEKEKNKKEET